MKRFTWSDAIRMANVERERKALRMMVMCGTLSRSSKVVGAQVKHRQRFAWRDNFIPGLS